MGTRIPARRSGSPVETFYPPRTGKRPDPAPVPGCTEFCGAKTKCDDCPFRRRAK